MNKNSQRKFHAAHDAFARIRIGKGGSTDELLARSVGVQPALDKFPKVGRSAREISRRLNGGAA